MRRLGHLHTPGAETPRGYCQTALAVAITTTREGTPTECTVVGWTAEGRIFTRKDVPYRDGSILEHGDSFHAEEDCPFRR